MDSGSHRAGDTEGRHRSPPQESVEDLAPSSPMHCRRWSCSMSRRDKEQDRPAVCVPSVLLHRAHGYCLRITPPLAQCTSSEADRPSLMKFRTTAEPDKCASRLAREVRPGERRERVAQPRTVPHDGDLSTSQGREGGGARTRAVCRCRTRGSFAIAEVDGVLVAQ